MKSRIIITLLLSLLTLNTSAKGSNQEEAKEMFEKVFNIVFGPKGSRLDYAVNIIGIYKTEGSIHYKDKKIKYIEKRYCSWNDGVTAYMVDKKKKQVDIFSANDENKDEMLAKFKYDVNNYDFSYTTSGDYYLLTAKVKKSSMMGIKEITAKIKKANYYPTSLKIKVAFFSTTVKISNFSAGGISDDVFKFPKKQFADYNFIDHRGEEK